MIIYKVFLKEEFKYYSLDNFDYLKMLENQDFSLIDKMSFIEKGEENFQWGDITIIDSSLLLLFSQKALNAFSDNNYLSLQNIQSYKLLVPTIIDSLNKEKSVIDYFYGTNEIKRIRKYVFYENKINEIEIFKLPIEASPVFVTENFVKEYDKSNCTGIEFLKIYDSNEEA